MKRTLQTLEIYGFQETKIQASHMYGPVTSSSKTTALIQLWKLLFSWEAIVTQRLSQDVKIFCNHIVFRNLAKCSSLLSWETRKPHANPQTARMTIKENQSTNIQTKHTYCRFCNPSSIIWLGVLPYYSSISKNLKLHNRI